MRLAPFGFAIAFALLTACNATKPLEEIPQQPPEPAPVVEDEGSNNISASVDETFTIALESNPTTGFSWQYEADDAYVELVDEVYEQGGAPGIVGAGGVQTFTFRAVAAGETVITLKYMRPWESVQPLETRIYTVTIAEE
ncbi:MAG: protease inhibitor I42 family protein [Candidatus Peribacteraceae bacterium]|jgi:inhibitor of cysteine peptidase